MKIILIGPPGCGKGTQAEKICETYKLEYVSTGNLIRHEIDIGSSIGRKVKKAIEAGHFVDDKTIVSLVKKRIEKSKGYVLDGFPRTLVQTHALEEFSSIDLVIDIQVSEAEVIRRISSRWMVETKNDQQSFANKTDAQAFAKKNGGKVFQRNDDMPDVVRERLKVYHQLTEPIITYYGRRHKLYIVNGEKSIENVWQDIQKIIVKRIVKFS